MQQNLISKNLKLQSVKSNFNELLCLNQEFLRLYDDQALRNYSIYRLAPEDGQT